MVDFPEYVDGKPPVISLSSYDDAEWAKETAVEKTADGYHAVNMSDHTHIVAKLDAAANEILDKIFSSAKKQFAEENPMR